MRTPELEWRKGRGRPSLALSLALLAIIAAGVGLLQVKSRHERRAAAVDAHLEHVLVREMSAAARQAAPTAARSPAELRQLKAQIALLNRDWPTLFADLLPGKRQVRLLDLDVNAETAAIRLTAHAPDADIANDYAEDLQARQRQMRDVKLLLIERKPDGVHFEVNARWAP